MNLSNLRQKPKSGSGMLEAALFPESMGKKSMIFFVTALLGSGQIVASPGAWANGATFWSDELQW
jgi:hypothetical protein